MNKIIRTTAMLSFVAFAHVALADVITISGHLTQSTQDGTGPAVNNTSLNNLADGDFWTVALTFDGSITAPGLYNNLTNASVVFNDPDAGASETSFGTISLTISEIGGFDQFSLFGCLTTGSSCATGNQLSASFQIDRADLNSPGVPATGLDQPHPLDLLEDDGVTDIQGAISGYSYAAASTATPEPSCLILAGAALALLYARRILTA